MNEITKTTIDIARLLCAYRAKEYANGALPVSEIKKAVSETVIMITALDKHTGQAGRKICARTVCAEITQTYEMIKSGTDAHGVRWNW